MNIIRLQVYQDSVVVFCQQAVKELKLTQKNNEWLFIEEKVAKLDFSLVRAEPLRADYVLYSSSEMYSFSMADFQITAPLSLSITSLFGGDNFEVSVFGIVKPQRYELPCIPEYCMFSSVSMAVQCAEEVFFFTSQSVLVIKDRLIKLTERYLHCERSVYNLEGEVIESSGSVATVTDNSILYNINANSIEFNQKQLVFEDLDELVFAHAIELNEELIAILEPADLYVNDTFVDAFIMTRPIIEEYEFPDTRCQVFLTENELAFTSEEFPLEFQFIDMKKQDVDEKFIVFKNDKYELKRINNQLVLTYEDRQIERQLGYQTERRECFGFFHDLLLFKEEIDFKVCSISVEESSFLINEEYPLSQEAVFAKNDDFYPRVCLKIVNGKYFLIRVNELKDLQSLITNDNQEVKEFSKDDYIIELSQDTFCIAGKNGDRPIRLYRIAEKGLFLLENNIPCEKCVFLQQNQILLMCKQKLQILTLEDGLVNSFVFDNFSISRIVESQAGIVIELLEIFGLQRTLFYLVEIVPRTAFFSENKCIASIPVGEKALLHCSERCFGLHDGNLYTVVTFEHYSEIYALRKVLKENEIQKLLIQQPCFEKKTFESTSPCCFIYDGQIFTVETSGNELILKRISFENVICTVDCLSTVIGISPWKTGVVCLLANNQVEYFVLRNQYLEFCKVVDLDFYGIKVSNAAKIYTQDSTVYIKGEIEGSDSLLRVEDSGNIYIE